MKAIVLTGILLLALSLHAQQPKYVGLNQLWGGYYSSIRLGSRWAVNSDFQGRTTDWYKQWSQVLGRTGLAYKLNDKFTVTAGFADFLYFQAGNKAARNEYRPWQEIAINDQHNKLRIIHRFRAEQRNFQGIVHDELVDSYFSNYRFRYKLDLQYPLWEEQGSDKAIHVQVGNELFVNAGHSIVYNYFDQNRTWIGLFYTLNRKLSFQFQYMTIFQQTSKGNELDHINVLRFNIYHTITL